LLLECKSMAPKSFIFVSSFELWGWLAANLSASRRSLLDDYQVCFKLFYRSGLGVRGWGSGLAMRQLCPIGLSAEKVIVAIVFDGVQQTAPRT
jgi:hypothetical protein